MNWHNVLLRPQNLYEELLRRKLISGGGVPAVLQTITGISPLTLLNVASKGIKSLTQFGKCEQASTPTPSVPVDIKCNNGAVKVGREIYTTPLGRTVYGGTLDVVTGELVVDRAMVDLGTLNYGLNNHATLGQYFWCDVYSRNIKRAGDYGTTVYPSICSAFKCVPRNTMEFVNSTYCFDGSADRVTQIQFKDSAYSDATSFKTAMSGVQLVYELATPQTYQLTSQTVEMIAERSMFQSNAGGNIDITYYANGILKTANGNPVVITDADGQNAEDVTVHIEPIQSGSGTPSPTNIRPISGMTDINITRLGGVVVDGTPETLTVVSETTQTASVENLFGVGDYKDEQDIISGLLTHKCGVKVLTSANIATFSNGCFFVNIDDKKEGKETTLSTHFTYAAGASSTIAVGEMGASGGASKSTFYKVGGVTSKAEAGAWVDGQYANGTPVIVVYPLAETTTEQVTAQHLRARDTATITAVTNNISDITLEVQYWQNAE